MIGYKHHLAKYGSLYAGWGTRNCAEAHQMMAGITSFTFIIGFMTVYQYLSHLAAITVKLQQKALDIVEAHEMIKEVTSVYKAWYPSFYISHNCLHPTWGCSLLQNCQL
jgi:hypothetical protein